jgi:hypothetical protein
VNLQQYNAIEDCWRSISKRIWKEFKFAIYEIYFSGRDSRKSLLLQYLKYFDAQCIITNPGIYPDGVLKRFPPKWDIATHSKAGEPMKYIGLDIHKKDTQACVLDEKGKVILPDFDS